MADQKVTIMVLKVDLQCCRCYKKIKKVLCKFPQIRDQIFYEKTNTIHIKVVCYCPEKIKQKIICKAGDTLKSIEIKEPEIPKPVEKPKDPEKSNKKSKETGNGEPPKRGKIHEIWDIYDRPSYRGNGEPPKRGEIHGIWNIYNRPPYQGNGEPPKRGEIHGIWNIYDKPTYQGNGEPPKRKGVHGIWDSYGRLPYGNGEPPKIREENSGEPHYRGYGGPPPLCYQYDGYCGRPVYDSYGGGASYTSENPGACPIM